MKTTLKITFLVLPVLLACTRVGRPNHTPPKLPEVITQPETTPSNESTSSDLANGWEADLLTMVNKVRREGCRCGSKRMPPVPPLSLDKELIKAAQIHADDMAGNNFFDHQGSDGSDVGDRATRVGFEWRAIGENISWGYPDARATFEGWLTSKGHCRNMMGSGFKLMGAAKKDAYWVQTFGSR